MYTAAYTYIYSIYIHIHDVYTAAYTYIIAIHTYTYTHLARQPVRRYV